MVASVKNVIHRGGLNLSANRKKQAEGKTNNMRAEIARPRNSHHKTPYWSSKTRSPKD
jgi:hypothetical protein